MRQGLNKHGTSGYHNPPGWERRPQVKIVRSFSQLHVLASITRIKCASLADTKVFENGCTRGRPMRILQAWRLGFALAGREGIHSDTWFQCTYASFLVCSSTFEYCKSFRGPGQTYGQRLIADRGSESTSTAK